MAGRTTLALGILCALAVGCGAIEPTTQGAPQMASSPASPAGSDALRVTVPAGADVEDIPWLMALEFLEGQGYAIETLSFADTAIEIAAMAQGDLDISSLSHQLSWAAIAKGAPHFTFMDKSANAAMTVTSREIQECADLDDKAVAVPSATSVVGAMLNTYMDRKCPGAQPQMVIVSGGSNRLAALLAGEVDAATMDAEGLLKLEREKPGEFHALIEFGREFPGLQISSYAVRSGFAEQQPEVVKDVVRAVLTARRRLQDPEQLRAAVEQYLDLEPETVGQAVDYYMAHKLWDTGGAFTLETVETTLEFLKEYGDLPPELAPTDVADLSYYNAVLDKLGRE